MLTAQTETLFSLQKSLLAGRAEMNAEWLYVDKTQCPNTEYFRGYGETTYWMVSILLLI